MPIKASNLDDMPRPRIQNALDRQRRVHIFTVDATVGTAPNSGRVRRTKITQDDDSQIHSRPGTETRRTTATIRRATQMWCWIESLEACSNFV
jgi:hypothetical protein